MSKINKKKTGSKADPKAVSQFTAVKSKTETRSGDFAFMAKPSGYKEELITQQGYKRFHGSRMLASWLPLEYYTNNTDRFGYMFPTLAGGSSVLPYTAAIKNLLERLGDEIGNKDEANSGLPQSPDATIPSGYTYLGQFIDHDITLDVNSDISRRQNPADIPNMRSPALDLDAIYGEGPGLVPFMYDHNSALGRGVGVKLLLGVNRDTGAGGPSLSTGPDNFGNPSTVSGGNNFDVPRSTDLTAIIGDPRNDENLIVSQLHHAFMKFHNKIVDKLIADNFSGDLFTEAKRLTTHHYQWVVVHDFLNRIADPQVVKKVFQQGPAHFKSKKLFMPVEFSVAAYRFGHSMIRNTYFVNAPLTGQLGNTPASLAQVFEFIRVPQLPVLSNWVIDFNLYFNARPAPTINNVQFNFARRIDTRLALGLESLPGVSATDSFMKMLAKRNMVRGLALGLPSGQAVAKKTGITPLTEAQLLTGNTVEENKVLKASQKLLLKKTPLWYYILKEAEILKSGNGLGPVGSVILAETFYRLLKDDANSYMNAPTVFKPVLPRFGGRTTGDYDITDILNFAGVLTLD